MSKVREILGELIDGKYNFTDARVKEKNINEALAKLKELIQKKKEIEQKKKEREEKQQQKKQIRDPDRPSKLSTLPFIGKFFE